MRAENASSCATQSSAVVPSGNYLWNWSWCPLSASITLGVTETNLPRIKHINTQNRVIGMCTKCLNNKALYTVTQFIYELHLSLTTKSDHLSK